MTQLPTDLNREEFTVEVFVRATSLGDPIDEKVQQLQQLEAEGVIDALLVRAWPDEVSLSADHVPPGVIDTYDRFTAWAAREGSSIEPSFQSYTRHSTFTGETSDMLTTPMMCLAVYEDGALRTVAPHTDVDGHHSVAETLDAIANRKSSQTTPIVL